MDEILKVEGNSVDGQDDNWTVNCPECDKEFEYTGYFESSDVTVCSCGCKFITEKVWLNDNEYIY